MLENENIIANSELSEWAEQSEYWNSELGKLQKPRKLRERNCNSLILSGHGASMRIDKGTLVIKEGFSHYPQKQVIHRFYKGSLDVPKAILLLDGSGSISFNVLDWLSEQNVSLIRIKWNGDVAFVCNGNGFSADQKKVDWQRQMHGNLENQIEFSKELITEKLENSIVTLENHIPASQYREKAIARAILGIDELAGKFNNMNGIRAIEGRCASTYFKAWTQLELKWKKSCKYPIPDHWTYYRSRSAVHECKPENRRASDPVNAMLNYAYGVKLSKLKIAAIGDGYDPAIGIMHHQKRGKPAYLLDLLEPERPKVDAKLLDFIAKTELSPTDFILRKDGACRLSPGIAKMIAAMI